MPEFKLAAVDARPEMAYEGFKADPEKSRVENYLAELHEYYRQMKGFNTMDAAEVFTCLSSFSARASELRSIMQMTSSQRGTAFRTKHIDPFLEECDRQFKVQSRIVAINEMDVRMAGGRYT